MEHSHFYAQIDRYAYTNALAKCSPITKGFFAVSALLISVSSSSALLSATIFLITTIVTLYVAKIPFHFYFDMFTLPTIMLMLSCLFIALFFGYGEKLAEIGMLGFTWVIFKNGVTLSITTFLRVESALSCLFFLVLTTSITDIFITLRKIKVPKTIVELSLLIYRYIFVFLEVSAKMNTAQTLRLGNSGFINRIRAIALVAGNLFIRTLEQGERTFIAMNARGYDGNLHVLEDLPKPTKIALIGIALFDAAMLVLIILTISIGVI
ncbi:MAG: cobalt ECF transporter T component CbiQ [Candidatus Bathyarchaeota archaeon]|nr:cobalt ECF transporter T component CbiQ [Candidatus Bathyarchaeota archaeon]